MSSTTFLESDAFVKNTTTIMIEFWFIPIDILMIMCTTLVIILSIFFLLIIILDKTCHTIQMMLVTNSYLTVLVTGSTLLGFSTFAYQNDRRQINFQDQFCVLRAYILNSIAPSMFCSFLLQALYRYIIVVYPTRILWQSIRLQISIISLTWILGFVCTLPYTFTGGIIYNVDNQICQTPLGFSLTIIYIALYIYIIPISLIMFIYFKLVRYVREMSKRVTPVNTLSRARSQLKMVRRTVVLVIILITTCFPLLLFALMSFFTHPSKYHFRIGYVFIDISLVFVVIALFIFTDPLKKSVIKRIKCEMNVRSQTGF